MMHWFILAALALTAAALLWRSQTRDGRERSDPQSAAKAGEDFRRWVEDPAVWEALERAVAALVQLMSHPDLGGPGFLTIRLPQPGEDGAVTVAAQYPNIREALYRRAVRRELDREALLADGIPAALLDLSPEFEMDSGGVVVAAVRAAAMEANLVSGISGRTDRQAALNLLVIRLERRFPALEVRTFGSELLLTPVRQGTVADIPLIPAF